MNQLKLNLGCGNKKIEGFIGVDKVKSTKADIIHDLNRFPYPFKDNSADEILMDNVLEHLEDTIKVMEELYRICKNKAKIKIYVPYAKSDGAFTDPTHKRFFTDQSFKYFEPIHHLNFYTKARFKVIKNTLIAKTNDKDIRYFLRNLIPFKKLLRHFLFNIYDEVCFELECIKNK